MASSDDDAHEELVQRVQRAIERAMQEEPEWDGRRFRHFAEAAIDAIGSERDLGAALIIGFRQLTRIIALEKALETAANDLDKAANQFRWLLSDGRNKDIFAEKAKRAREVFLPPVC